MPGVHVFEDVREEFPETVLLLTDQDGVPEVRASSRDEPMVVAYSDYAVLAHWCGAGQPWIQMIRDELVEFGSVNGIAMVSLDVPIPEGHRYPVPDPQAMDELPSMPVMVAEPEGYWVASRPYRPSHRSVTVEMQPDESGAPVLLAYTSKEMLNECCGPYQEAVLVAANRLSEFAGRVGAGGVLFNPMLEPSVRHSAPVLDWKG